jgi:pyruvate formate lyase activating enzyme
MCVRKPGENGRCRARGNRDGEYQSLVYGRPCVIALDEVEKCPLNHVHLEGKIFSIATAGCNLQCKYCQNWEFSQAAPADVGTTYRLSPRQVVQKALSYGSPGIAYFYTEPTVYYEYMLDIAKFAREEGLKNIMVTAGYVNPDPLKEALLYIDAITIGLKGWDEDYYRNYIGGEVRFIKETIEVLSGQNSVWWEVVNLVIPSLNDDMDQIAQMSQWLLQTAGPERPLHFTRFRPEYRLKRLPMTPMATLTNARETAMRQGLKYVYVGNMPGHQGSHTYCAKCGKMVIERLAFKVLRRNMNKGRCGYCGHPIGGVWL